MDGTARPAPNRTAATRAFMQPLRDEDPIAAFQACVAALDCCPLDEPLTDWDVLMISNCARKVLSR